MVQGEEVPENKVHCDSVVHKFAGDTEAFRKVVPPASAGEGKRMMKTQQMQPH